ncbi:transketolase [Candidatus Parcubacteria bacterium]|jgi:transketolase|nr:MAG: transketolase [Candidatus Parcubacteria bacterium]
MHKLQKLAQLIRYFILISTTKAGSGHPSSALSATDLMTGLLFGGFFKADLNQPKNPNNDRLIFSKGHAAPLLYALYAAAGKLTEKQLLTLRKFNSPLEGHPMPSFAFTEAPTGSLGQGLSIGLGMALNARLDKLNYKTFVLLGDSEMAEGQIWEAVQLAAYYKLDNLIGILDVNRLGQRGQTMYGHNLKAYQKRLSSFGWKTILIDGHDFKQITKAFVEARKFTGKPVVIIAKTLKGKGVSILENKNGWHGKTLKPEQFKTALAELGPLDKKIRGIISKPVSKKLKSLKVRHAKAVNYAKGESVATREAYGNALVRIAPKFPNLIALDAEVSNSTYSEFLKNTYPKKFLEMFIAEQNMIGTGLGLALRGKLPFISSFAAFLTRAFDQIRMSQYANAHLVFCGSHAGVSIGEDGASQMGLEDLAMFRTLQNSIVLYPSDAVAAEKLVEQAAKAKGLVYLRTTRGKTPVIYRNTENFPIGGCKILKQSQKDVATIIAAGITLHEALKAYTELQKRKINVRIIDLYSLKPIDVKTLRNAAKRTKNLIVVEDHVAEGGIGEAVKNAVTGMDVKIIHLAVKKIPRSGRPEQLLDFEGISAKAIVRAIHSTSSS